MTLNVTSSEIQIKNSLGNIKFTSNDRLMYQKYSKTGSLTVSSATVKIPYYPILNNKDFLIMNIVVTSCTGSTAITSSLINNLMPANGGIIVDFYGRNVSNYAAADTEILSIGLLGSDIVFKSNRFDYANQILAGTITTSLTYYARTISYL